MELLQQSLVRLSTAQAVGEELAQLVGLGDLAEELQRQAAWVQPEMLDLQIQAVEAQVESILAEEAQSAEMAVLEL